MKIECVKDNLYKAILSAERVTAKQLPLEVLGSVVLRAKKNVFLVQATNLSISLEYNVPSKVIKEGEVAVPSKTFLQYINNLSDNEPIILELIDNNLHIKSKNTASLVKTLPLDDFPTFNKINTAETEIKINSLRFIDSLKSVVFAASFSDIKPEIASVCISGNDNGLEFISTDSFRLARQKFSKNDYELNGSQLDSVIVPIRNVHDIIRVFDGLGEELTFSIKDGQASISSQNIYLLTQLIDSSYPNVSQIFPKGRDTEVIVLKQDLVQALRISQIFADKFNRVMVNVSPKEKSFEIESKNQDTGENINSIEATLDGEDVKMQFNGKYILDVLNIISEDSVSLEFSGPNKPMVVKGVGNNGFTYLLMPLRV